MNVGWNECGLKWMWGEMIWGEMKWGELKWGDMKWGEMKCGDMIWGEMKCGEMIFGWNDFGVEWTHIKPGTCSWCFLRTAHPWEMAFQQRSTAKSISFSSSKPHCIYQGAVGYHNDCVSSKTVHKPEPRLRIKRAQTIEQLGKTLKSHCRKISKGGPLGS